MKYFLGIILILTFYMNYKAKKFLKNKTIENEDTKKDEIIQYTKLMNNTYKSTKIFVFILIFILTIFIIYIIKKLNYI